MLQKNVQDLYVSALPQLMSVLGTSNPHAVPAVEKVVVSMGLGSCLGDRKKIDEAVTQLSQLTGQRAVITRAKKSVSGFRLREGVDVGCCVTLRKRRMYSFLSRLLFLVLPRVRDFRGLRPTSFDGHGNYSFGLSEQSVFPEIDAEKVTFSQGMNVSVVTSATNNENGRLLLAAIGFPFAKE
jgi:large subunit ribosomal protein L5